MSQLLKIGVAGRGLLFTYAAGAAATTYFVFKNGAPIGFGTGAIFNSASPGAKFAIVTLSGNDVNTLGTIQVALIDAGGNILAGNEATIVTDIPGATVSSVTGDVVGNVDGVVNVGAGSRLAIAQDVINLVDGIELGLSPRDCLRACFAVLAGKDSAPALGAVFRNFGDTKNRVTMAFDAQNERVSVTYDFS